MARVAIVGLGAIGCVVATALERAGKHQIIACVRQERELEVLSDEGRWTILAPQFTEPKKAPAVDCVLLCTKTYDVPSASRWFQHLRKPDTPVVVLQNGVEHRERVSPYVPVEYILPAVVDCPAERGAKNTRQRGPIDLKVPQGDLGSAFAALFEGSRCEVEPVADFATAAWAKLCINCAGILPALLLKPSGIFRNEPIATAAAELIGECAAVGRAEGAKLEDTVVEEVISRYRELPPEFVNSMHADRVAGRPLELDARNGVVVRLGQKHGIKTPASRVAVSLLQTMLNGR